MQTRFLTALATTLNPFSKSSKTPRLFLSMLPPTVRSSGVQISVKQLPQTSRAPSTLQLTFKDGKVMNFEFTDNEEEGKENTTEAGGKRKEQAKLKDVIDEVERHSRGLARKEDLAG